jgi:hypothetical protein
MTLSQAIIEAAYSRSTANDPGKLATDGELLSVLDRVFQMLYAVKAVASPEGHTIKSTLALVASVATLPTDVIDIRRVQGKTGTVAAGAKINIIPVEEIDRGWHLAPRMYRTGLNLTSVGGVGDPGAADSIDAYLLDAPPTLATLATALDPRFPVRFHELLIVELAMYLSTKDADRDAAEFTKLSAYRNMQLEAFLKLCGLSMTALQSPHGGVIVQKLNSIMGGSKGG